MQPAGVGNRDRGASTSRRTSRFTRRRTQSASGPCSQPRKTTTGRRGNGGRPSSEASCKRADRTVRIVHVRARVDERPTRPRSRRCPSRTSNSTPGPEQRPHRCTAGRGAVARRGRPRFERLPLGVDAVARARRELRRLGPDTDDAGRRQASCRSSRSRSALVDHRPSGTTSRGSAPRSPMPLLLLVGYRDSGVHRVEDEPAPLCRVRGDTVMEPLALPLPTFLIIGAQKSATRWLRLNLGLHPDVFAAAGRDRVLQQRRPFPRPRDRIGTGSSSRAGTARRSWARRRPATCSGATGPAVVAERIEETLPDVRLIATLRNPIDRAQSAMVHHIEGGSPPERLRAGRSREADATRARQARDHRGRVVRREPRALPGAVRRPTAGPAARRRRRRPARRLRPGPRVTSAPPPTSCRPSSSGCASAISNERRPNRAGGR